VNRSETAARAAALALALAAGAFAFATGALILATGAAAQGSAGQQDPRAQRGRVLAQANCAKCHAVGPTGDSPLGIAPPFRTLHARYPVESLEEALVEGIVTGHPTMPEFRLDVGQARDLIAYLKTLER
jgi:cytochrome c